MKTHYKPSESKWPVCGVMGYQTTTTDQDQVTCGHCRNRLGLPSMATINSPDFRNAPEGTILAKAEGGKFGRASNSDSDPDVIAGCVAQWLAWGSTHIEIWKKPPS